MKKVLIRILVCFLIVMCYMQTRSFATTATIETKNNYTFTTASDADLWKVSEDYVPYWLKVNAIGTAVNAVDVYGKNVPGGRKGKLVLNGYSGNVIKNKYDLNPISNKYSKTEYGLRAIDSWYNIFLLNDDNFDDYWSYKDKNKLYFAKIKTFYKEISVAKLFDIVFSNPLIWIAKR